MLKVWGEYKIVRRMGKVSEIREPNTKTFIPFRPIITLDHISPVYCCVMLNIDCSELVSKWPQYILVI